MILKIFIITGKKKFRRKILIMSINLANIKVDIILPNYNSESYLSETIDSILNQTFKNWKHPNLSGYDALYHGENNHV